MKVACSDIDGILRGKYLHKDKFEGVTEGGFGFCDVAFGWDCGDACPGAAGAIAITRPRAWHLRSAG